MADFLIAIAEVLMNLAFIFTDVLKIRLVAISSTFAAIVGCFYAGFHNPGMTPLILSNLITLLINAVQVYKIIIDRMPILLPEELRDIYKEMFYMMTPKEFFRVYHYAEVKTYAKNSHLAVQDKPIKDLLIIKSGKVNLVKDGVVVTQLGSKFFVGEMSFLSGGNANATVTAIDNTVECIQWDKKHIHNLEIKDPELCEKFKRAIAINLIKKVNQQPARNM